MGITVGQVFLGKYRVEQLLGQGGMGVVARCTHLALNEQVALKMLRPDVLQDEEATSRFMREAQAAVKLRSEYVARVTDVGTFENGVPYMVMEYLDGQDLGVVLHEQGKISVQWATELMLQAAEALAEAHSIGIVHRDVKPTNLFVTWRPDGSSLVKVLDFGISKSPMGTDMQLTQTQSLLGTPAYMSPEQMRSARLVDQRTDIWSLGTVMYELIEGHRPFEAESFSEMCVKVAVDTPLPMVNTPPALQQVVLRCLAKTPEQRYPSMADLGRDLVPFARDPHTAQMMVDRMFRMLGRTNTTSWERASAVLPVPVVHSAAVPVAIDPGTLHSTAPVASPKRRTWLVLASVALVGIAAGATALVLLRDDEPAPVVAPAPPAPASTAGSAPPVAAPPEPVAPAAVEPAAVEPAAVTAVAEPVVAEPAPKRPPIRRPTSTRRPPATKVKDDKTHVPAVEPAKAKPPVDVYSTPRPGR